MIVLIGFMAAGKTSVGRLVAQQMGLPFFDTDLIIERHYSRSVADIFAERGEAGFREIERQVVLDVLNEPTGVVALGAGAVGDPMAAARLEWMTVVYLKVAAAEAMRRIGSKTQARPMLQQEDPVALLAHREPHYEAVVDRSKGGFTVDTVGLKPEEVASEVVAKLGGGRGGVHRVVVPIPNHHYTVAITHTAPASLVADELPEPLPERALVVTIDGLQEPAAQVSAALGARGVHAEVCIVADGEAAKNVTQAELIWNRLAGGAFHRDDLLVAIGGGAVCDLAGFAAATFSRGMRLVLVPTTLLAQADAAVGGKNGLNLATGKNLVGTIHQPDLVLCDTELLATLPRKELSSGLAEVIKHGLIADPDLVGVVTRSAARLLAPDPVELVSVVARSVAIKAQIVALDEREQSVRAHLNYGHTFGHAMEQLRRGRLRHGEAIALGMMAAAFAAQDMGHLTYEEVLVHEEALTAAELPVRGEFTLEELAPIWRLDKKYKGGVRFVLLRGLGHPQAGLEIDEHVLRSSLARLAG